MVLSRCRKSFLALGLFFCIWAPARAESLKLVRSIPHSGYSEGLDYFEGYLWNATPQEIHKIDPKNGAVVETLKPATSYSESVAWVLGHLWNVSFADNGIYEAKGTGRDTRFVKRGTVPEVHAWGLTFDGKHLIVTGNYSDKLYFLNPETMAVERTIQTPVKDLEDLAWDGKGLWASSFTSHRGQVFWIDPKTGNIPKFYSLPHPEECPIIDGTAFDGKYLWVTGKHCSKIYCLALPQK